jgi:hypothetical protein
MGPQTEGGQDMSFEDLLARVNLIVRGADQEPEDAHELLEKLHLEIHQMRAMGQPVPEDLAQLERRLESEFSEEWEAAKARGGGTK